jgi:hypothetical protein
MDLCFNEVTVAAEEDQNRWGRRGRLRKLRGWPRLPKLVCVFQTDVRPPAVPTQAGYMEVVVHIVIVTHPHLPTIVHPEGFHNMSISSG